MEGRSPLGISEGSSSHRGSREESRSLRLGLPGSSMTLDDGEKGATPRKSQLLYIIWPCDSAGSLPTWEVKVVAV